MQSVTGYSDLNMPDGASTDVCCQVFEPERWDEKTHEWSEKLFLQDTVLQVLHIPVNMGVVVKRMFAKIEKAQASPDAKDFLMLAYDCSPWKSHLYMTVTKKVPDGIMTTLSGTYVSKVFDGPYHFVPKWIAATDEFLAGRNQTSLKYYFHYAYCPKCAKKYGHNYCTAFAQVA